MPRKPAITEAALKALGPKRLAALVLEACERDDVLDKKVRMMLAAKGGSDMLNAELTKRIKSLAGGRTFRARDLVATLDTIRTSVFDELAAKDPRAAAERLWQLIEASDAIMESVDDSSGMTGHSLGEAVEALGQVLLRAGVDDALALATRVHARAIDNGYGVLDGLVRATAPALGAEGRAELRRLFEQELAELETEPAPTGDGRRDYQRESRRSAAARGLMDLADAEGSVDDFLRAAELGPHRVANAEEAARRLLKADRPAEALAWLQRVPANHAQWRDTSGDGLVGLMLQSLDALGRQAEAQALRWQMFEHYLSAVYLRDYLKRLPDFEDDAVMRKAIAHALDFKSALEALMLLVDWPDLDAAARLVMTRAAEIDFVATTSY